MTYLSVISDDPERDAKSELEKAVEKLTKNTDRKWQGYHTHIDELKTNSLILQFNDTEVQPLFLLYYKQLSQKSSLIATDIVPNNVIACSDPDELLDLDLPLSEAQKAFIRCCGDDEEFLPAPEVDPDLEE